MSAHTPGPWRVGAREPQQGFAIEADSADNISRIGRRLALVSAPLFRSRAHETDADYDVRFDAQSEANARLIAAAPELLQAAKQLVEEKADYMRLNHLGDPETQHTVRVARAAIAKAGASVVLGMFEVDAPPNQYRLGEGPINTTLLAERLRKYASWPETGEMLKVDLARAADLLDPRPSQAPSGRHQS